jgi:enamine deaminase RidA (YjgF/YER057c/UK114 family)
MAPRPGWGGLLTAGAAVPGLAFRRPIKEIRMTLIRHNPEGVFPPYRCSSHAVEVQGEARLLVISGLNGYQADGRTMPESFQEQGDLVWTHLRTILRTADMDYGDLVSIRTYLADPRDDEANVQLRVRYLGTHQPASTVVCCQLLDPRWKLELEAMAARSAAAPIRRS